MYAEMWEMASSEAHTTTDTSSSLPRKVSKKVPPPWTKIVSTDQFFELLGGKRQLLNDSAVGLPSTSEGMNFVQGKGSMKPPPVLEDINNFIDHLNALSKTIHIQQSATARIHFLLSERKSPYDHPTGTKYRPDFVAIKVPSGMTPPSLVKLRREVAYQRQSKTGENVVWSQLETTGEIYSQGLSDEAAIAQGAAYARYLLQARPDLVSVVCIFIHPNKSKFVIYFADAWGVCHTELIDWGSPSDELLYAWIHRLYNPETRLNIGRASIFPAKPTFSISTETHGTLKECTLLHVGSPFNRRSTIFTHSSLIIKSQYVQEGRRFREDTTLQRIHKPHEFPGVVRLAPVTRAKQEAATAAAEGNALASSSRGSGLNIAEEGTMTEMHHELDVDAAKQKPAAKRDVSGVLEEEAASDINMVAAWPDDRRGKGTLETLLLLQDKAEPLIDAETPLDALIAFYDLLEVTRFLYKLRKVLHRDISAGNVLLRRKNWKSEEPFADEFADLCFATHLLGEKGPDPKAGRLHTRVLLIDFDLAEDRSTESGEPSTDRIGTPMFMARLVRHPVVSRGAYNSESMPQVGEGFALAQYKSCVGDRINNFPKNDRSPYWIEDDRSVPYSHRLSYEAESTLWLLLSWIIQAKPKEGGVESYIPENLWVNLTGGEGSNDSRSCFLTSMPATTCHPAYEGLTQLLRSLFEQLSGYQEQVVRPPEERDSGKMKDDYLHEALQRTILNFIVENIDKPFMHKQISTTRRLKEPGAGGISQSKQTIKKSGASSRKRDHEDMVGSDVQSDGQGVTKRQNVSPIDHIQTST